MHYEHHPQPVRAELRREHAIAVGLQGLQARPRRDLPHLRGASKIDSAGGDGPRRRLQRSGRTVVAALQIVRGKVAG